MNRGRYTTLTESRLNKIVDESIKKVLREGIFSLGNKKPQNQNNEMMLAYYDLTMWVSNAIKALEEGDSERAMQALKIGFDKYGYKDYGNTFPSRM